ncbi:MAG: indole-3-glycerol phosphate synthase TrpC [Alphaproteobacteria bacterium]|jgi:indole-3-glycerol phosphate synthase|nr:indole-3-glycerol phosphate synthase TrpC [Alphaproteobacteria bacterium]
MADILQEICQEKRRHVAGLKAITSQSKLEDMAKTASPVRGFEKALAEKASHHEAALICELKKASPSAGQIRDHYDPATLAKDYERGGATCLSILTDGPYFQGINEDMEAARAACSLPVLRKDFIIDPWQAYETRAIGGDCLLLIMAALSNVQAAEIHQAARSLGLDVLIETHNEEEVERALALPNGMIGINNRNLKTLVTDLETTARLAPLVPKNRMIVCESGLKTSGDLQRMMDLGVYSFLIGESLVKQDDLAQAVRNIIP